MYLSFTSGDVIVSFLPVASSWIALEVFSEVPGIEYVLARAAFILDMDGLVDL
jgi:hypothetical protein